MSRSIGSKAVQYLMSKGHKILDTNYTTRLGEIDILSKDHNTIVFTEVKMRSSSKYGLGREFVTPTKLQKIIRSAHMYLKEKKLTDIPFRIDVIEFQGKVVTHLENITL